MIVVRLRGGLGNQMFQYATARRAALVNHWPLKLDTSAFEPGTRRAYGLQDFRILGTIATAAELAEITGPPHGVGKRVHRIRRRFKIGYRWTWIQESCLAPVNPFVLAASAYSYLDGYWQTEKYFADVGDTIRREFTIASWADRRAEAVAGEIAALESVSIHVRRGDYVSHLPTNQAHGTCTLDYYHEAVRRMSARLSRPHFFVFSDDPEWVAANLRLDHPTTLVSGLLTGNQYDDLRLMSLCRHHIIANSSFSWWGAWLNPRPDKVVIAPRQWGNDPSWDDRDLLPESWITVER